MPKSVPGLIVHHHGIYLATNNSICDTFEARPPRLRGEVTPISARAVPESVAVLAKWLKSTEPAQYEIQLKTGAACLVQSRASTFNGLPCRLAKVGKLGNWC